MTRERNHHLEDHINKKRREMNLSVNELANLIGVTSNTYRNISRGLTQPREEHITALEQVFDWPEGEYERLRQGEEPTDDPSAEQNEQMLKPVGSRKTRCGRLAWVNVAPGLRDYTLTRLIAGRERGVTLRGTPLPPNEAMKDLQGALKAIEEFYKTRT